MRRNIPLESVSPDLRVMLRGADWQRVTIGESGAEVYRIVAPGQPLRYLKSASGPRVVELRAERERLSWLASRLPVPAIHGWADQTGEGEQRRAWLLLSEAPGRMACDAAFAHDPRSIVRALADGLRRMHSLPLHGCPFDARLDARLAQAEWMIQNGLTDEAALHERHGFSATHLLDRLVATRPSEPDSDLVFTHGDYCLPNVLLDPAPIEVSGYLDLGRSGIADRYQDLAIGARSVRYNLGAEWGPRFLDAYDVSALDAERLMWYETLDELF
ncbi:MAG TPA: APH(3') family aminoglycoside O-phosphotransferase [Ktedonobacterales bacterium]|jgi:aminoglycoside phosphotransferase|nr:APH(3') family aminoglycoside O-phosphotransferase [Ktedonobacterales bacterium]